MRVVSERIVWLIGILCLGFGVVGLFAMSPVTMALAVTGWFLCRSACDTIQEQGDIQATTPDVQYWARTLLFRAFGLMAIGAMIAGAAFLTGFSFHFSVHAQLLLTSLMIAAMVVVAKLMTPGFFAASWEVHGMRERRRRERSSTVVSRFIVRSMAVLVLVTSLVSSFALLQSLKGGPHLDRMVAMAQDVSSEAPSALGKMTEIFSPTESVTR